ncbi:hypothetical protein ACS0TY_013740 [Phlomoides rotata]
MSDPLIGKGRVGGKNPIISSLVSLFEQPIDCSSLLGLDNIVGDHANHDPIGINVDSVPTNTLVPTLDDFPPLKESMGKGPISVFPDGKNLGLWRRAPSIDVRLKFMKSDLNVVEIPSHGISRDWDSTLIGGWLLFKLSSEVDVESVLNGGLYSMWGRTLMLKKMPLGFRFNNFEISVMPVWIKLKFLPMCCWNNTTLSLICSKTRRPTHTDRIILTMERVSYVRVLVEVDAAEPLVREVKVIVEGVEWTQLVEYEFEPKYYKTCGKFGHGELTCPSKKTWEQKRVAYLKKEEEKNRKNEGRFKGKKREGEKVVDAEGITSEEGFVEKEGSGCVNLVEVEKKYISKGKGRFEVLREEGFDEGLNQMGSGPYSNFRADSGAVLEEAVPTVFSSPKVGKK